MILWLRDAYPAMTLKCISGISVTINVLITIIIIIIIIIIMLHI
jgi:hypothetical protein